MSEERNKNVDAMLKMAQISLERQHIRHSSEQKLSLAFWAGILALAYAFQKIEVV